VVLGALRDAAQLDGAAMPARTVVTVPASFQLAQRRDTRSAAESAAIGIGGGDLLDEPVAAFLDWVFRHPDEALSRNGDPVNLLVFDFGGGTCAWRSCLPAGSRAGPPDVAPPASRATTASAAAISIRRSSTIRSRSCAVRTSASSARLRGEEEGARAGLLSVRSAKVAQARDRPPQVPGKR
jgi:hypothetical protein